MSRPLRLRSSRVVLGTGELGDPLRVVAASVDIRGGKIVAVNEGKAATDTELELCDLGDKLLTPAFVNAHTHLALCALRGVSVPDAAHSNRVESLFFAFESKLSAADVRAFARIGAMESLLTGVGMVWDHYYFGEAVADAVSDLGLCGVVAPTLQDLSGPGKAAFERNLDTTLNLHGDAVRRNAGVFAALGPHASDTVSGSAWTRIAGIAESKGLPIHAHVAQSPEEVERIVAREGCDPVSWLERLGVYEAAPSSLSVHAIFSPLGPMKGLGPAHRFVFCPRAQQVFAMPARVDGWSQADLQWVVATDAAASNDAMDVRLELAATAACLRAGAANSGTALDDLLQADTTGSADLLASQARAAWTARTQSWNSVASQCEVASLLSRVWGKPGAVHPDFRAGVIQAGALANLVVWDLDHPALWPAGQGEASPLHALVFSGASAAIWNVTTMGSWRGEGGNFAGSLLGSEAWREARSEADGRLAALRGS